MELNHNMSIEQLENKIYPVVTDSTGLVFKITSLRKKPIADFSIEDMRICISQNESLVYLIPLAINQLTKDILAEGDFYEGDLIMAVIKSKKAFWAENKKLWQDIISLCEKNKKEIESSFCRKEFINCYETFKLIHKD